jgi:hypothetical protein
MEGLGRQSIATRSGGGGLPGFAQAIFPVTESGRGRATRSQSFANYLDLPMVTLREEFTPIFDDYGVDVVYGGHSHSYERSYYLGGYTGDAVDFDPAVNAELNSAQVRLGP